MLERRKKCPNCNEQTRSKLQNKIDGVGLCVHCDVVYGLYEHRYLRANELGSPPEGVSFLEVDDTLYITANERAKNSKFLYWLAFILVSIPVGLMALLFLITGEFLQLFFIGLIFWIPFSCWCILAFLLFFAPFYWERIDTYEFTVNPQRLDIYYKKGKWWTGKRNIYSASTAFLEQLFVSTNIVNREKRRNKKVVKRWKEYFFTLRIRQKDYQEDIILTTQNREMPFFVEKTIEYYLGIDDRKVSDEEYLKYPLN